MASNPVKVDITKQNWGLLINEFNKNNEKVEGFQSTIDDHAAQLAESTQLKGTTQNIIFNTDGTVQKVQHKDSYNVVLREDVFTYTTNLITEVRTLSSGGSITFKYHLDTLQTEVI
jgi:hypothetical protein